VLIVPLISKAFGARLPVVVLPEEENARPLPNSRRALKGPLLENVLRAADVANRLS